MLIVLNETETELPLDTAAKRARIADELRHDDTRSDREIGRVCGCDGKTVAAVRKSLSDDDAEISADKLTPTERREMLVEGCKDFDNHFPPGPSEVATAEEAVDNAIARGRISLSSEQDRKIDKLADMATRMGALLRADREPNPDGESDPMVHENRIIESQPETCVYWNPAGQIVIRQRGNYPDEDPFIYFDVAHAPAVIAKLQAMLREGN